MSGIDSGFSALKLVVVVYENGISPLFIITVQGGIRAFGTALASLVTNA